MKIYLSQSMTNALDSDRLLIKETRNRLEKEFPDLEIWDPGIQDDSDLSMREIQNRDFRELEKCDGLLAIWGPTSSASCGLQAELEWARRVFHIPAVIYQPSPVHRIGPWTFETVQGRIRRSLVDCVRLLMDFMAPAV